MFSMTQHHAIGEHDAHRRGAQPFQLDRTRARIPTSDNVILLQYVQEGAAEPRAHGSEDPGDAAPADGVTLRDHERRIVLGDAVSLTR
jgi:hypothetical protein